MAAILCLALASGVCGSAHAQTQNIAGPREIQQLDPAGPVGFSSGSTIIAPIPFQSPLVGSGLAVGGAYLFKSDEGSDSSFIGGGAFRTDNGSEGYAAGVNLSFGQNVWSTKLMFAQADLNYDLYANGRAFSVSQSARGVSLEFGRAISDTVRVSATVGYAETSLSRQSGAILPPGLDRDRKFELARYSLSLDRDLRDDNFYPTDGSHVTLTLTTGHGLGALDRKYGKAVLTARKYLPLSDSGVLAGQATLCGVDDEAPFFDSCALGAVDALRGYVSTEFIGNALMSAQVEYRGRLTRRLGSVVFAGAGTAADDFGGLLDEEIRVAGGVGARIRLSKTFPVDYAIDMAVNQRGDRLLYVSLGQRF